MGLSWGGAILGGQAAENILNVGSQAFQLLNLRYSRENEEESDKLGVEYASLAGYEAAEGAEFFTTLQRIGEREGQEIPSFLSTHPNPGDRREEIRRMAAQYDAQIPTQAVDQEAYLRAVESTVFGENPRQGFVENGVFYHPDLRFLFPVPRGFNVINQPLQVVLVAPNQEALQFFQIAQTTTAEAAARQFAQQQGIQVVESGPVRSGNLPAYYVVAQAQLQSGQDVGVLAYFVEYEGNTYTFTGLTTVQQYDRYDDVFLEVAQGFSRLTDPRILSIEPWRINVVPASRSASFRTFVPAALPQDVTPEDLAILNQVQLDTTIPSGTLLKLPAR